MEINGKNYVNLTGHDVTDLITNTTIPKAGTKARAILDSDLVSDPGDIPTRKSKVKKIVGLPEPKENTIYIVSSIMLNHLNRNDVVAPGPVEKDENNEIIGCNGFRSN